MSNAVAECDALTVTGLDFEPGCEGWVDNDGTHHRCSSAAVMVHLIHGEACFLKCVECHRKKVASINDWISERGSALCSECRQSFYSAESFLQPRSLK